jgi:hypothetical protein
MLNYLNIPQYFIEYGRRTFPEHCFAGRHDFWCWNAAFIDVAPHTMAVF